CIISWHKRNSGEKAMRSIGGMRRIQIVIDENRLRLLKEQWLPVAAFVALTLPLVFIEPTPSQPASSNEVPTPPTPAPQPPPVSTPPPLPQAAARPQAVDARRTAAGHKSARRIVIRTPDRKVAVMENG